MLTRRTATVTISAPEASCARTITAGDGYLPVPTISRDVKVLPAITRLSMASASADEIHDLNLIAVAHLGRVVSAPFDHVQVVLDGDAPRIDLQTGEQGRDAHRPAQLERLPVHRDSHASARVTRERRARRDRRAM